MTKTKTKTKTTTRTRTAVLALLASTAAAAGVAPAASAAQIGERCLSLKTFTYNDMHVERGDAVVIRRYAGTQYYVEYVTAGGLIYHGYMDRDWVDQPSCR